MYSPLGPIRYLEVRPLVAIRLAAQSYHYAESIPPNRPVGTKSGMSRPDCYFFSDGEGETKHSPAVLLYSR